MKIFCVWCWVFLFCENVKKKFTFVCVSELRTLFFFRWNFLEHGGKSNRKLSQRKTSKSHGAEKVNHRRKIQTNIEIFLDIRSELPMIFARKENILEEIGVESSARKGWRNCFHTRRKISLRRFWAILSFRVVVNGKKNVGAKNRTAKKGKLSSHFLSFEKKEKRKEKKFFASRRHTLILSVSLLFSGGGAAELIWKIHEVRESGLEWKKKRAHETNRRVFVFYFSCFNNAIEFSSRKLAHYAAALALEVHCESFH